MAAGSRGDDEQQQQQQPIAMRSGPTPAWGSVPVPDPTKLTSEAVGVAKDDLRRELLQQRELLAERIARLEKIIADLDQRFSAEIGRRVDAMHDLLTQRDESIAAELHALTGVAADSGVVHDALRERLEAELGTSISSLRELIGQRVNGVENELRIFQTALTEQPEQQDALRQRLQNDIMIAVENLRRLHEERFTAIQQQFTERDTRTDQEKKASQEALNAALLAQKESVAQQNDANTTAATKSETSFTKQIDQIGTLIATLEKSLTDRITELKERIDRGEGTTAGGMEQRTEHRLDKNEGLSTIVAVIMAISVLLSVTSIIIVVVLHK